MKKKTTSRLKMQEGKHSSEPQKAHATGEFAILAKNGGHTMCHLVASFATVVRQADQKLGFGRFKKKSILGLILHARPTQC